MIAGKLTNDKNPSLESAQSLIEEINGFEVVFIKSGVAAKDVNAFMKKCLLKKEAIFKI